MTAAAAVAALSGVATAGGAGESLGAPAYMAARVSAVRPVEVTPLPVLAAAPATIEVPPVPVRAARKAVAPAVSTWTGVASWYGDAFAGRRTASGERFDPGALTAAHRTLPFGARVRVTDLRSGRSVEVRINDRGPHIAGREIDLSRAAAEAIGIRSRGTGKVRIELL